MKIFLGALVLGLLAAGPQCETRGPSDAGSDSGVRHVDAGFRPDSGNHGGPGGWDPSLPDGGFPGSGKNGDTGTDVVFFVRMDRGLANHAALYQRVVDQVTGALTASGLTVTQTAVASLQDGQLLWGQAKGKQPQAALADVLTYYAQTLPDQSAPCSTVGLASLAGFIPFAVLSYPDELVPFPRSEFPFSVRPGAFLAVLIDGDVRYDSPAAAGCSYAGVDPIVYFGGEDTARWLSWWLPRPQTRFWAFSTPENAVALDQFRTNCLAQGFPPVAVDVVGPSSVSFYEPWATGMNAYFPRLVERADFCAALMEHAPVQDFADAWAKVLRGQVGLP